MWEDTQQHWSAVLHRQQTLKDETISCECRSSRFGIVWHCAARVDVSPTQTCCSEPLLPHSRSGFVKLQSPIGASPPYLRPHPCGLGAFSRK